MSHALHKYDLSAIVKTLVTEDDEPVDNLFSEKQQRLLTEPLYSCWTPPPSEELETVTTGPRPFLAAANVGVFFSVHQPPLVPDMFLSLDVQPSEEWNADECRSYFVWEFGKVPDAVVEVVSNREGNELDKKMQKYAQWGISYYVVFDPFLELSQTKLAVYEFGFGKRYRPRENWDLPTLGLKLILWEGEFEGIHDTWLRWCDAQGQLIPTGKERADSEAQRADSEAQRADSEAQRADSETQRADSEAQRADSEAQRAVRAEAEVAQLRAELARLQNSQQS